MKEKKLKANWYVAATHYLTAGLVFPFIIGFVGTLILVILFDNKTILSILSIILGIVAIWLGVKYSAKFLKKNYIIKEKNKIINLAAVYYLIIGLINVLYFSITGEDTIYQLIWGLIGLAIYIIFFVFTSKKYIIAD